MTIESDDLMSFEFVLHMLQQLVGTPVVGKFIAYAINDMGQFAASVAVNKLLAFHGTDWILG